MILLKQLPPKVLELAKKRIEEQGFNPDEWMNRDLSLLFRWRKEFAIEANSWCQIYYSNNYEPLYQLYPELRP